MKNVLISFLFFPTIFFISCNKEQTEIDWQDLTIGDELEATIVEINDTIAPKINYYSNTVEIDLNQDSIKDIEFIAHLNSSAGGYPTFHGVTIKSLNDCEIMADTTMNIISTNTKIQENYEVVLEETSYNDEQFLTATPLTKGYIINDNQKWIKTVQLYLCYSTFRVEEIESDIYRFTSKKYNGWLEGEKNLGFRLRTADMIYHGCIELEVLNFDTVVIKRIIFR